eukprot:1161607-Pelagomonas_calceolata.AAC.7
MSAPDYYWLGDRFKRAEGPSRKPRVRGRPQQALSSHIHPAAVGVGANAERVIVTPDQLCINAVMHSAKILRTACFEVIVGLVPD